MTPELKIACEIVFQEHKTAARPVAWNREVFRGRLSTGLSEKAKETLVEKQIICFPNPAKKNHTILNPMAVRASSFTEAEDLVINRVPAMASIYHHEEGEECPAYVNTVTAYLSRTVSAPRLVTIVGKTEVVQHPEQGKWYLMPALVYVVWPLLSAVAGGVIAYLIGEGYTELMFNLKK